jgi:hypothetical protein
MVLTGDNLWIFLGLIAVGAGTGFFSFIGSWLIPPKVVEWRLDPPEGLHQFEGNAEPSEAELNEIERQKQSEILYHAIRYNRGKLTTQRNGGLFTIIEERWNARLKDWPQYRHWHIGYHWMREAIAKMDYDTSGLPVVVADGNSAGVAGGYYLLISPTPGGGRGEHDYRRLVPLNELVELWRKTIRPPKAVDAVVTDSKPVVTAAHFEATDNDTDWLDCDFFGDGLPDAEGESDVTK